MLPCCCHAAYCYHCHADAIFIYFLLILFAAYYAAIDYAFATFAAIVYDTDGAPRCLLVLTDVMPLFTDIDYSPLMLCRR